MRGQRHTPTAPYLRERPGTHCTGGWVCLRAGLDRCGKSRPHRDSIPGPSSQEAVVIPTELSWPTLLQIQKLISSSVLGVCVYYTVFYIYLLQPWIYCCGLRLFVSRHNILRHTMTQKNGYITGQLDKTRKEVSKLVCTTTLGVSLVCPLYFLPTLIVIN